MKIRAGMLTADEAYKLLTGSIVPRPIAWITTISREGLVNAAPFSAFTFLSNKPPMIGVSIGRKAGKLKDTARNIMENGEFVVNIADLSILEKLHASAEEYDPTISETEELNIETEKSIYIETPMISYAPISMECKIHQVLEFGSYKTNFFVGEILAFHIRDEIISKGKIETRNLDPVCRLGGAIYASLGKLIKLKPIGVTRK